MRSARLIIVAVAALAVLRTNAYCLESTDSAGRAHLRSSAPSSSKTVELAADSTPDPITAEALGNGLPASGPTAEIPSTEKETEPPDASAGQDPAGIPDPPSTADSSSDQQQTDDDPQPDLPPHVYSLQDFINQGIDDSPLGMELREDCTKFESHEKVCGLAVLDVRNGSPADNAGVKRYTALTHDLLDGASVAAALVFPPAIVAVAVIDQSGIGESFDLIIGVDGRRVRHILDFQDLTSNVRPGDTVYLTIVRAGRRVQLPVQVPSNRAAFRN
jgi:hypothetical protein